MSVIGGCPRAGIGVKIASRAAKEAYRSPLYNPAWVRGSGWHAKGGTGCGKSLFRAARCQLASPIQTGLQPSRMAENLQCQRTVIVEIP